MKDESPRPASSPSSAAYHDRDSPFSRPSSPNSPSRHATSNTSPGNDDIPPPQEPDYPSAIKPLSEDQVEELFDSLDAAMEDGDVARVLALIRWAQAQQRADIDEGLGCIKRRLERLMHCGA